MRGKTLGIVGYGHIGTQVGVLAESLGMQVLFHDIETKLALGNAAAGAASLDALLARRGRGHPARAGNAADVLDDRRRSNWRAMKQGRER